MFTLQHKDKRNHNKWTPTILPKASATDAHSEQIAHSLLYPTMTFRVINQNGEQVGPVIG